MIPKTFLSEIGSVAPFSIENGTFYQISDTRTGKRNEKQLSINRLEVFAVPSLTVREMEALYFEQNSDEIHEFQEEFIKTAIKNARLYSEKDIKDFLKKNGAIGFIINEIFPYYLLF